MIISMNGADGTGKTTQIALLKKKYGDKLYIPAGLGDYYDIPPMSEEEHFNWWFYDSTPEEFCKVMYDALKRRNDDAQKSNKIVVFDKGIDLVECRILANFLCRGMTKEQAENVMHSVREEVGVEDIEDKKIFLTIKDSPEERVKLTHERKGDKYGNDYYMKYQYFQNRIIDDKIANGEFCMINASKDIAAIAKDIAFELGFEKAKNYDAER